MWKGFNIDISLNDLSECYSPDDIRSFVDEQKNEIKTSLYDFYMDDGGIDASKLMSEWFPTINDRHIFISHSHKDIKLAEKIAYHLWRKLDIKCFIDSHVWGYAGNLLKIIDKEHSLQSDGYYSYATRNITTSNIHMMLSSALNAMINRCECLLFINTKNSIENIDLNGINEEHTSSPWIMSELVTSSLIGRVHPIREAKLLESLTKNSMSMDAGLEDYKPPVFHYKVPLEHLYKLSVQDFNDWVKRNEVCHDFKNQRSLDDLYLKHGWKI